MPPASGGPVEQPLDLSQGGKVVRLSLSRIRPRVAVRVVWLLLAASVPFAPVRAETGLSRRQHRRDLGRTTGVGARQSGMGCRGGVRARRRRPGHGLGRRTARAGWQSVVPGRRWIRAGRCRHQHDHRTASHLRRRLMARLPRTRARIWFPATTPPQLPADVAPATAPTKDVAPDATGDVSTETGVSPAAEQHPAHDGTVGPTDRIGNYRQHRWAGGGVPGRPRRQFARAGGLRRWQSGRSPRRRRRGMDASQLCGRRRLRFQLSALARYRPPATFRPAGNR